jgi:6-pyruvoyltetrahydropterin/6-carboxytetrahydropterin synthase
MIYELSQQFYFEAAHTLNRDIETTGSRRIHGHTYHAEVTLLGEPEERSGMVADLGSVRRHIEAVKSLLDHHFLDDVPDLGPATLENLCKFIFDQMISRCPQLLSVSVARPASGDKCVLRKDSAVNQFAISRTEVRTREPHVNSAGVHVDAMCKA